MTQTNPSKPARDLAIDRAIRFGKTYYRDHVIVGASGAWRVLSGGDEMYRSASISDCLHMIDEVMDDLS